MKKEIFKNNSKKYCEKSETGYGHLSECVEFMNESRICDNENGILVLDSSGVIQDVNETACYLMGFSKNEILGVSIENFFIESLLFFDNGLNEAKRGNSICFEKSLLNMTGQNIFAEINIYSICSDQSFLIIKDNTDLKVSADQNQKIFEELKFNRDLLEEQSAELVRLSTQLSESEERLKGLLIEKDKFISIIAHDIKSPFTGLIGLSRMICDEFDTMEKVKTTQLLFQMDNLIKNQYLLIENLLDWSRLQTGKLKCELTRINIYDSFLYIISLISQNAENKSISIINNVKENIFIRADERMLDSVIENIIANAIKFTPRGGTVIINSSIETDLLKIAIQDSGVGIAPQLLENIFRIDFSHSTNGTENEKGTGLGLLMCKEMIEKQEGSISIKSRPGKGTEVSFRLPVWKAQMETLPNFVTKTIK